MAIQNTTSTKFMSVFIILGLMLALPLPVLPQNGPGRGARQCCLSTSPQPLTSEETTWLVFMREEEKLARDVYQQMYAKWNLRIFDNIAASEQRHFDSIGVLIARYNVEDPAKDTPAGYFSDARLATLYAELIAKGNLSVKDALEVGALIEKQDIADLETALLATQKADIKTVYTNLLAGSLNHQEAFDNTLEVLAANQ